MPSLVRFTPETFRVVEALAAGSVHGFDILDVTGLPSGTVYPILRRLDAAGLVKSRWENVSVARDEQRPPRRYYELSAAGRNYLAEARERFAQARARTNPRPATS